MAISPKNRKQQETKIGNKTQQYHFWVYTQKTLNKDPSQTMFIVALFVIAEPGNNLDVPQPKNG